MSKESYARGFCKVAEAAGVDPVQLAKFAAGTTDAGIGSLADNVGFYNKDSVKYDIPPHPGSYFSALRRNGDVIDASPKGYYLYDKYPKVNQSVPLTQEHLEHIRNVQAGRFANAFFPENTAPYHAVKRNMIQAGERNADEYRRTGNVKPKIVPDKKGIENIQFPSIPEYFKGVEDSEDEIKSRIKEFESKGLKNIDDMIRLMQNSMASKGVSRTGNIA